MEDNKYFAVGKLMAYIVVHNGPMPKFLSKLTFDMISQACNNFDVSIDDISDKDIQEKVKKVSIALEI